MVNARKFWILLSLAVALARAGVDAPKPDVDVCLNAGEETAAIQRAEIRAARIFSDIGVHLVWRRPSAELGSPCILITLAEDTPAWERPGALAFAKPFDGDKIVVFHDRVKDAVLPSLTDALLAHVLVHEIAHVLQREDRHSATGMMKSRWGSSDYKDMARAGLTFTPEDVEMIRHGLEIRIARSAGSESNYTVRGGEL
ncbi:hypothetical protein [uncultured Paludibaculum sp.]|uniref:hypothetical protein n=1 Tax=uncultured Paludibaculum sp. TaxID=1765020 RepID=UPI002AAA93FC|nr:hypothetical protein [uncultured Paludibaculum sp.]